MIHGNDTSDHLRIAAEALPHPTEGIPRCRADACTGAADQEGAAILSETARCGDGADVRVGPRRWRGTNGDAAIRQQCLIGGNGGERETAAFRFRVREPHQDRIGRGIHRHITIRHRLDGRRLIATGDVDRHAAGDVQPVVVPRSHA